MKKAKKFILSLLIGSMSTAFATSTTQFSNSGNPCKGIHLRDNIPIPKKVLYKVILKKPFYNMCEMAVNIGGMVVPVYATKDWALSGDLYVGGKNIGKEFAKKGQKIFVKEQIIKLSQLPYIPYTPKGYKNKDKYIYFVADPNTKYSNLIKGYVTELADKYKVQIRLLLYALSDNIPSVKTATAFFCSHRTYEDFLKNNYGNLKNPKNNCKSGYQKEQEIFSQLHYVLGVPLFMVPKGDHIYTYVGTNKEKIKKYFELIGGLAQ